MNTDDKIRAILRMEADAVDPSPAGWDAITTGVAARRRRAWWLRGGAFATAALTVAAVAFVATADPSRDAIDQAPVATAPPSVTASATATNPPTTPPPSPTVAPVVDRPTGTIWPLTTTGEVAAWEADASTYPSLSSASGSALAFARNYLGATDATVASLDQRGESFFFEVRRGGSVVSLLELRGYGGGGDAPYLVRAATSDDVSIAAPAAGGAVTGPLRAHGTYATVDPSFVVTLRADGAGSAPVDLAEERAVTGPPDRWDATLTFSTKARTGSLLVTNASLRDGGIGAAAAVPVTFGTAAAGEPIHESFFAAVRDNRIALVSAATGRVISYVTAPAPYHAQGGVTRSHPDVSPDGRRVVWSEQSGPCAASLWTAPTSGGTPPKREGTTLNGVATTPVWAGNDALAYQHIRCDGGEPTVRLRDARTGAERSLAPAPRARYLAASPDGRFVAFATDKAVTSYEVATGRSSSLTVPKDCVYAALDVPETTSTGRPVLVTAHFCDLSGTPVLYVERGTPGAPDRDRVAEVPTDGPNWRISLDAGSGALLVSHGLEDGPSYVSLVDRKGTSRVVARDLFDASW